MSKIEEIKSWRTADGEVFPSYEQAAQHQTEVDFDLWYESHRVPGSYLGSTVDCDDLKAWLRGNKRRVLELLGAAL